MLFDVVVLSFSSSGHAVTIAIRAQPKAQCNVGLGWAEPFCYVSLTVCLSGPGTADGMGLPLRRAVLYLSFSLSQFLFVFFAHFSVIYSVGGPRARRFIILYTI